jgi:hypothetical protein
MKTNFKFLIILALGIFLIYGNDLMAQSQPLGNLMNVTEFTIKPGHESQFREGIKLWKACYLKDKGAWTWRLWRRQQGEGNVYVLASDMANWAEMDKTDESGRNCQILAMNMINPHIEKSTNHVTRFLPEISKNSLLSEDEDIIRVTAYELNSVNGYRLMEVVREVEGYRKKANMNQQGYWYAWLTYGPESPNYHFVYPYKSYADIDIVPENIWQLVEKSEGKAKREELQAAFRSAIHNTVSYIYKLDKDLSRLSN